MTSRQQLSAYTSGAYDPGRGRFARSAWYVLSLLVFESGWFPCSRFRAMLLRIFGAHVGYGVVIKPHVRIKYPWRLSIGDHCWIGQDAWIDNLADVSLGDDVCVSQGAYVCTGSHDHRKVTFDLIVRPVIVRSGVWIGARALILGGVTVWDDAVVAAGCVVTRDVESGEIVAGNPAQAIAHRSRDFTTGAE